MEKIVPISVCPKHCDANFYVDAEQLADMLSEEELESTDLSRLEADAFGEPIDISLPFTALDLDDCRQWECQKCGARPLLVDCASVYVETEDWSGWLLIPLNDDDYIYYTKWGDGAELRSIPTAGNCKGVPWYSFEGTKIYPLRGNESLDTQFIDEIEVGYKKMRLFIEPRNTECEGQIQMLF